MDAPYHFFSDLPTIDNVPLEICMGTATMIRLPDLAPHTELEPEHFSTFVESIQSTRRIVMDTSWHHRWEQEGYFENHPVFTAACAQYLVDLGVVLVAVDFPSVDRPPFPAHEVFLGNGLIIVENLTNLGEIPEGVIEFVAIPLKIAGRDGSPVRALAGI
jgi:kynurenine formamidase